MINLEFHQTPKDVLVQSVSGLLQLVLSALVVHFLSIVALHSISSYVKQATKAQGHHCSVNLGNEDCRS
jgi:hypothetical protein